MTHLSIEALLSLREPGSEPGTAAAREHLNKCPQCQTELDRLHQRVARLKALAPLRPSRDRWPETAAKFRAERLRRRRRIVGLTGLATAASLAAVVAVGRLSQSTGNTAEQILQTEQIHQVMERSQALENALSAYNPEARVLDGRTARMAQELEDRIARLDRELEATELLRQQVRDDELLKLWRERVGLLDALVDVHVTRASNAGL
jgi:DNA repair exonuclease SbcCD ATPase subunit